MKQLEFLKKMVELGRIPHALLFYGPDNQGKKDMALEFVKLINGEDSARGVHPDLFFVGPAEDTQEIKIAQIRDLHAKLSLRSYSAPFKAAIIEQAHCLNDEAQSAFLKLLEEPKGQTIFILITEYPEMLFPTILSRVEKLRFYSRKKDILPQFKLPNNILSKDIMEYNNLILQSLPSGVMVINMDGLVTERGR